MTDRKTREYLVRTEILETARVSANKHYEEDDGDLGIFRKGALAEALAWEFIGEGISDEEALRRFDMILCSVREELGL